MMNWSECDTETNARIATEFDSVNRRTDVHRFYDTVLYVQFQPYPRHAIIPAHEWRVIRPTTFRCYIKKKKKRKNTDNFRLIARTIQVHPESNR